MIMKALGLLITLPFLICDGQSAQFNCKPRRGCEMPRCDPSPVGSPAAVLKRNEYPIICVGNSSPPVVGKTHNSEVTRREYNTLLNLYGRQRRSLDTLNVDVSTLRRQQLQLENTTQLHDRRLDKTDISIRNLERTVSTLRTEQNKLRLELDELKKAKAPPSSSSPSSNANSIKIKALESSLANVLMIVAELSRKNLELEKDIKELASTKAPSTQRTPPRWQPPPTPRRRPTPSTTRRTTPRWQPPTRRTAARASTETTTAEDVESTTAAPVCESVQPGVCFFLITKDSRILDADNANAECQKHDAFSVLITSPSMYKAILKFVKERRDDTSSIIIRTGMVYDTSTKKMTKPYGAYTKWAPGAPRPNADSNSVVLRVSSDERRVEGMINVIPYVGYGTVLCQRWIA